MDKRRQVPMNFGDRMPLLLLIDFRQFVSSWISRGFVGEDKCEAFLKFSSGTAKKNVFVMELP